MGAFVNEIVLPYLDHKNPIIRRAAAKAGSLLYVHPKDVSSNSLTRNIMSQIIQKFLGVVMTDRDKQTRLTMLESLNENFDIFLSEPQNLRMLFLCPNDPDTEVRAVSMEIICRLIKYNSSYVVPFLKKNLYELISNLNTQI